MIFVGNEMVLTNTYFVYSKRRVETVRDELRQEIQVLRQEFGELSSSVNGLRSEIQQLIQKKAKKAKERIPADLSVSDSTVNKRTDFCQTKLEI